MSVNTWSDRNRRGRVRGLIEEALCGPLNVHPGDRDVDGRLSTHIVICFNNTVTDSELVLVQRKGPANWMEKPCSVTWLDLISIASLQTFGVVLDWGCEKTRESPCPGRGADRDRMVQDKLLIKVIRARAQVDRSEGVGIGQEEI